MNEDKLIESLNQIKTILEKNKIKFWLDTGTLLGAVRDKKLIPWDYDLDLGAWYEDISKIIAEEHAQECFTNYDLGGLISEDQKSTIDTILRELRNGERKCNIEEEVEEVLKSNPENGRVQNEGRLVDFHMVREGIEHYFEIKTVKPNIDVFAKSKSKLLEWVARRRKIVKVFLAFPYNPYYPKPYERFTLQGLLKSGQDLLIGEEYWEYLGGKNTYEEILNMFDIVGKQYKIQIDQKIKEVAQSKMNI